VSVKVEYSVVVERPVENVWAFMDDLNNYPEWIPGLAEIRQLTEGPKTVGTRMTWVYTFLGRPLGIELDVTEWEPNQTFAGTMRSGPLHISSRFGYEPVTPTQTRITIVLEGETGGVFKLADPLVGRALHRQMEAAYGNLKDVLEARVLA
jgi:uncharacterized membrane protein